MSPQYQTSFFLFQESGRAGRDGLPAQSVLYYGVEDRRRMDALLAKGDRRHARKRPQPGGWCMMAWCQATPWCRAVLLRLTVHS